MNSYSQQQNQRGNYTFQEQDQNLKDQIQELRKRNLKLNQQLEDQLVVKQMQDKKIELKNKEIQALEEKLNKVPQNNQKDQSYQDDLSKEKSMEQESDEENEFLHQIMKSENIELKEKISEYENTIKDLEKRLKQIPQHYENLELENKQLKIENTELSNQKQEFSLELDNLKEKDKQMYVDNQILQDNNYKLQNNILIMKKQIKSLTEKQELYIKQLENCLKKNEIYYDRILEECHILKQYITQTDTNSNQNKFDVNTNQIKKNGDEQSNDTMIKVDAAGQYIKNDHICNLEKFILKLQHKFKIQSWESIREEQQQLQQIQQMSNKKKKEFSATQNLRKEVEFELNQITENIQTTENCIQQSDIQTLKEQNKQGPDVKVKWNISQQQYGQKTYDYTGPEGEGKYRGDWENGQPQGYGMVTYKNGSKFIGKWLKGKRHGKGQLQNQLGQVLFQGEFQNNNKNGYGVQYDLLGEVEYQGLWSNNKKVEEMESLEINKAKSVN